MHRVFSLQKEALKKHLQRRLRRDRNISWLIHFGGWLVLAALLVLLWHLVSVVLPMFRSPEVVLADKLKLDVANEVVYVTQSQGTNILVSREKSCHLAFHQLEKNNTAASTLIKRLPLPCSTRVKLDESNGYHYLFLLNESNLLRVSEVTFLEQDVMFRQIYSSRLPELNVPADAEWQININNNSWLMAFADFSSWQTYLLNTQNLKEPDKQYFASVGDMALLSDNTGVLISKGKVIQHLDLQKQVLWEQAFPQGIRYFALLPSGKGFIVQLDDYQVQKWVAINVAGETSYQQAYVIDDMTAIERFVFFGANQLGLSFGQDVIFLLNTTTGEVLSEQPLHKLVDTGSEIEFFWHGGQLGGLSSSYLYTFDIERANASITLRNLFGKVLYEGHQKPDYVWQSSAGSDNYEAKYSVIPLVIGSIKAALLAISVALPLGLGAAVYTAYFAPAEARKWLKPAIEMLEAVPSVVIGFIAAVWLLPLAKEHLATLLSFFVLLPVFVYLLIMGNRLLFGISRRSIPINLPMCFIYLLIFAFLLSSVVPFFMAFLEQLHLPSIFFLEEQDTHSKNTIVVAIALGIAIAPSIYSLAEDAIFEVPATFKRASYALGATRLQTLLNVVLKVAYPGILSALMLGFSRALGETMILLMVTGNTPIAEWDLISGMRTLTANLAIELPESEVGGVHYQVLFLTALLLLLFTMGINTIAELLRLRLKKKYRHE